MDLYTKLSNSMEELTLTFETRMRQYDEDLQAAASTDTTHKTIASLSREFIDFKCLMWKTVSSLKLQLELLLVGLDRHEMMSRREVLLLHGLGEEKDEDCSSRVAGLLSDKIKLVCNAKQDFVYCHRLGSNNNKPRPLLIRFQQHHRRSEVWNRKTLLKGSGLTFSEFLTKPRHEVFVKARKHFGVRQCWTSDGKVVIQLPNKSRRKIESASELRQLLLQFPEVPEASEDSDTVKVHPVGKPAPSNSSIPDKRIRKPAKVN